MQLGGHRSTRAQHHSSCVPVVLPPAVEIALPPCLLLSTTASRGGLLLHYPRTIMLICPPARAAMRWTAPRHPLRTSSLALSTTAPENHELCSARVLTLTCMALAYRQACEMNRRQRSSQPHNPHQLIHLCIRGLLPVKLGRQPEDALRLVGCFSVKGCCRHPCVAR